MSSMAGRKGRGLALLEALKNQKQTQPGDTVEDEAGKLQPQAPEIAPPARGRASLLLSLAEGTKQLSISAPVQAPGTAVSAPAPAGRANLLALARSQLMAAKQSNPGDESQRSERSVEHTKVEKVSASMANLASEEINERPAVIRKGEAGKPIKATANFVRLGCEPGKGYFQYVVKFIPDVDSHSMRFRLLNACSEKFGKVKNFDGALLYLPIKLPETITVCNAPHPVDGTNVEVQIIFQRMGTLGDSTYFYNVLFNKIFKVLKFARLGRQHYDPTRASSIPAHKLEIWPGYVTAIEEFEGGVMLNINASHRVLRQMTCYDVLQDALQKSRENWKNIASKDLIGACVLTRYNYKLYRVDDIEFTMNAESTFEDRNGGQTSFLDYYKKQYDLNVKDVKQPMLISKEKVKSGPRPGEKQEKEKLICLVPELCYMTGLTDSMRADYKIMKDIATYTKITPNQRQLALKKFIKSVKENPEASKILLDWGLTLEDGTVSFQARVVPNERIVFGRGKEISVAGNADWSREAVNSTMLTAVDLNHWSIVCTRRDRNVAEDFATMLKRVGTQMGMEINQPQFLPLENERTDAYVKILRDVIKAPLQLVVTICPTSRDDRYAAIKKITCAEQPVASQVIITKTISKPDKLRSVVQKIALQINCKLGGALWAVKIPFDDLMVCGMDVYHDPTRRGASVTGFVASLNQPLTRWFSKVIFQTPGQELVDGLKTCLILALKKFYDVNGKFPNRIVMFRDGVGDGQLKHALEWEIPQLLSCFSLVNPMCCPKLTVVIVQKRINCRIFHELNGNFENPPPGTVVDHTITRRDWYDFFLVSQFSNQGTVTPTHYVVIHDGCQMKVDYIQRLSYKLTHMYYNWPGTIRVPAPCQYAHKLAYLVGQSIRKEASDKLSDRLFFL